MSDGVWLVELAAIGNSDDVPRLTADTLGVRDVGGVSLTELVAAHLEAQTVMLVFDNCEHVVDGAAEFVGSLLGRCPEARILATSREGLGVSGEQLVAVAPLDAAHAGTELFRRAEPARSTPRSTWTSGASRWKISADDSTAFRWRSSWRRRGCERSHHWIWPPGSTTDSALLTAGRRSSIERHRTLRETVAWSFDLLEPDAQLVFARLSVFIGTFDLGAAEAVGTDGRLDEFEVDDLLDALVDRSMVTAESGPFGRRFRLLETMRQFAAEKLHEDGDRRCRRTTRSVVLNRSRTCRCDARKPRRARGRGPASTNSGPTSVPPTNGPARTATSPSLPRS